MSLSLQPADRHRQANRTPTVHTLNTPSRNHAHSAAFAPLENLTPSVSFVLPVSTCKVPVLSGQVLAPPPSRLLRDPLLGHLLPPASLSSPSPVDSNQWYQFFFFLESSIEDEAVNLVQRCMPILPAPRRPRKEGHLSPGAQVQPEQHSETPSQKRKKK